MAQPALHINSGGVIGNWAAAPPKTHRPRRPRLMEAETSHLPPPSGFYVQSRLNPLLRLLHGRNDHFRRWIQPLPPVRSAATRHAR
jgi:hypothetical protein